MGTTQRIGNGVKKDPNWGNLSTSVTSAAKAIESIKKLDSEEKSSKKEDNSIPKEDAVRYAKQINKLDSRKNGHIKASIDRLVKIGGGSKNISSGKSTKIGRAGLKASSKLVSFFISVGNEGLRKALDKIGFGSLEGKSTRDIIDFLNDFFCDSNVGMDEAAAKAALCEVTKNLSEEANEDVESLEQLMKNIIDTDSLSSLLCTFFGIYIYEYLWERLEERLRQIRGEEISKATFDSIKKEIQGRVTLLNSTRPLSKINWEGNEGKLEIEHIFETILKIEGE
jgi:hypothetical protein